MNDYVRYCYRLLHVEAGATREDVKKAYRARVKVWHPDALPQDDEVQAVAAEWFQRIQQVYADVTRFLDGDAVTAPDVAHGGTEACSAASCYPSVVTAHQWYSRATSYARCGQWHVALAAYARAVEAAPSFVTACVDAGGVCLQMNDCTQAFHWYNRSIQAEPYYAPGYEGLAAVYRATGQPAYALEAYQRAISLNPQNPDTFFALGVLHEETSRWQDAAASYQEALRLNPWFSDASARLYALPR